MDQLFRKAFECLDKAAVVAGFGKLICLNRACRKLLQTTGEDDPKTRDELTAIINCCLAGGDKPVQAAGRVKNCAIRLTPLAALNEGTNDYHLFEVAALDNRPANQDQPSLAAGYDLFNSSPNAIAIIDEQGIICDVNNSFEILFEYSRPETLGHRIDELIVKPAGQERGEKLFQKVLSGLAAEETGQRLTRSGRLFDVLINYYPLKAGIKHGLYCASYKIIRSELQKEKILHEKDQFLAQLFNKSIYPIAILDRDENVLDLNPEFEKLFGFKTAELLNKNINRFIVPDQFVGEAETYFRKTLDGKTIMLKTLRKNRSGDLIDVEVIGSPVMINNRIVGMFAMYRDRRIEEKALHDLRRERAHLRQLFANSPDPTVLLDDRDRIVDFNKPFAIMFGYKIEEARGKYINDLITRGDYVQQCKDYSQALIIERKIVRAETIRTGKDGRDFEVELIAFPILLDEDQLGAYAIYRNITDRKNKEREIQNLINRDPLTGLFNRKYAYDKLTAMISEAEKTNSRVSFVYFDLDGFKRVNDERGHLVGDKLLVEIAARLKAHFQDIMEICRVGGDEFLAIIIDPCGATIDSCIDQLKQQFAVDFTVNSLTIGLDLSIGHAIYPDDGLELDRLISKADSRMYLQKKINRIRRNPFRKTTTIEELIREQGGDE